MHGPPSSYALVTEKARLVGWRLLQFIRPGLYTPVVDVKLLFHRPLWVFFMRYRGRASPLLPAEDKCVALIITETVIN